MQHGKPPVQVGAAMLRASRAARQHRSSFRLRVSLSCAPGGLPTSSTKMQGRGCTGLGRIQACMRAPSAQGFECRYGSVNSGFAMCASRPLIPRKRRNSGHRWTSQRCRLCCKSLKTPGDKFPARSRNKPRSLIDVASGSLPKSPVSLSAGDEVPPHVYSKAASTARNICDERCKKTFATQSATSGHAPFRPVALLM